MASEEAPETPKQASRLSRKGKSKRTSRWHQPQRTTNFSFSLSLFPMIVTIETLSLPIVMVTRMVTDQQQQPEECLRVLQKEKQSTSRAQPASVSPAAWQSE